MIVVAIIGILAAVALPAYSDYQAKSKVTAGLAEIASAKTIFQLLDNEGTEVTAPDDIGLKDETSNCKIGTSETTITCEILNASASISGETITLTYDPKDSTWSCSTTLSADDAKKYAPQQCR